MFLLHCSTRPQGEGCGALLHPFCLLGSLFEENYSLPSSGGSPRPPKPCFPHSPTSFALLPSSRGLRYGFLKILPPWAYFTPQDQGPGHNLLSTPISKTCGRTQGLLSRGRGLSSGKLRKYMKMWSKQAAQDGRHRDQVQGRVKDSLFNMEDSYWGKCFLPLMFSSLWTGLH